MTVEIKWFAMFSEEDGNMDMTIQSLDKVSPDLMENYPGFPHYQCPAFQDSLNNTFILRCPVDVSIRLNKKNNIMQYSCPDLTGIPFVTERLTNGMYQNFTFQYFFTFITKHNDVMIEQLPAFYHKNDFTDNCQLVIGQFNIGKWIRPINLASAMVTTESEEDIYIHIKKGNPLSYVRFNCKDNIKLKRIEDIEEIKRVSNQSQTCTSVKRYSPRMSLKKLYDLFKPFNRKYKKSCPFNIFKK
jgi:hypothetical protein